MVVRPRASNGAADAGRRMSEGRQRGEREAGDRTGCTAYFAAKPAGSNRRPAKDLNPRRTLIQYMHTNESMCGVILG